MKSRILQRIKGRLHKLDEHMQVRRMLPSPEHRAIGPFVFLDHMGPVELPAGQGMDVRPHPHIGLSTVTYLWDGRIEHRDSLGNTQLIEPGAVNWMASGRGIVHSERTAAVDRDKAQRLHGLQFWVALPLDSETMDPFFEHTDAAELPELEVGDARLRVVAGEAYGARSPVSVTSELFYVDARIPADGRLPLPGDYEQRAAYVIEGAVQTGGETAGQGEILIFEAGAEIELIAARGAHVVLFGGVPLDGPRYVWWNYVASSEALLESARRAWAEDRMGRVAGDPERIPLPGNRPAARLAPE